MKVAKTAIALLFVMLLASSVIAVSDDTTEVIEVTKTTSENKRIFTSDDSLENVNSAPVASKASISLNPRRQTSSRTATYEVTVKAHYLPNTDALAITEYTLDFDAKDRSTTGEFSRDTFTLQPGEKLTVELKVQSETAGEHDFDIEVTSKDGFESEISGMLFVVDSNTEASKEVKIDLQPEKKYTETGKTKYGVVVYRPLETPCYSNTNCAEIYDEEPYNLEFISEHNALQGEFTGPKTIYLKPGEKKSTVLEVKADFEGTYVFKVYAKTQEYETGAKGLMVYGKEPQISSSLRPYIEGEGFATNEDQSQGKITYLSLLGENGDLRGKMAFGSESYALKGEISDDRETYFSLYKPQDGGFSESIGEFHGKIEQYETFSILQGSIDFEIYSYPNQVWRLTVLGKQNSVFEKEIVIEGADRPVTQTINKQEVVTIRQTHRVGETDSTELEAKEAYIVPEKIERKKILGIIPNPWGDKILKVKMVDGDEVIEEEVKEFGSNKVGEYEVSVGSLEDEEAIEVSIKKST